MFGKNFSSNTAALISILIMSAGFTWLQLVDDPPLISHPSVLRAGDVDTIKPMIIAGIDINHPNSKGITPLHVVAQEGHVAVAQLLLQNGANLHARYDDLWTPLHLAAQNGHLEMATLLINYGGRVIGPKEDFTPLHFAAQEGYLDIAQLLLTHDADVRARYLNGWTPLHLAAQEGHTQMVNLLLEHGAPIHAMTAQGFTPLHSAAFLGRLNSVKTLLMHHAPPTTKDHEGQTPLQLAIAGGFKDVAQLLSAFEETGEIPKEYQGGFNEDGNNTQVPGKPNPMPSIDSFPKNASWEQA